MQLPDKVRERLSGKVRGRRQLLTGKTVMQVEVIEERSRFMIPCPPPTSCKDTKSWEANEQKRMEDSWRVIRRYWRDATPEEAFQTLEFVAASREIFKKRLHIF